MRCRQAHIGDNFGSSSMNQKAAAKSSNDGGQRPPPLKTLGLELLNQLDKENERARQRAAWDLQMRKIEHFESLYARDSKTSIPHSMRLPGKAVWTDIDFSERRYGTKKSYLVLSFFHLLWLKKPSFMRNAESRLGEEYIVLPDTLLFERDVPPPEDRMTRQVKDEEVVELKPSSYYYTSVQDKVTKRRDWDTSVNSDATVELMAWQSEYTRSCDIVARYVSQTMVLDIEKIEEAKAMGHEIEVLKRSISIKFFTKEELLHFLRLGNSRPGSKKASRLGQRGFVQKFVHPQGEQNEVYKAVWSPIKCEVWRCVNSRSIYSPYSAHQRMSTFVYDGADVVTAAETKVLGTVMPVRVAQMMCDIANHIAAVSENNLMVWRMNVYFKLTARNKLETLHCDYLQFQHEISSIERPELLEYLAQKRQREKEGKCTPLVQFDLWPQFGEHDVNYFSDTFKCPQCNLSTMVTEVYATPIGKKTRSAQANIRVRAFYKSSFQIRAICMICVFNGCRKHNFDL